MRIPTEREVQGAYHALRLKLDQINAWVEYAQWVRFEPRLGEAWVAGLARQWKTLNAVSLRERNIDSATPAILGVLLDQCEAFLIPDDERLLFRNWKKVVMTGVRPATNEIFFIGIHPFASASLFDEMTFASRSYRRWGFGGKDIFINKFSEKQKKKQKSLVEPGVRAKLLSQLIRTRQRITVEDYLIACEYRVSRRVAQKDLSECRRLEPKGNSRARFYVKTRQ